jgi:hypothetical protein
MSSVWPILHYDDTSTHCDSSLTFSDSARR